MLEETFNRPIALAGGVLVLAGIVDLVFAQTRAAPENVHGKLSVFGVASIAGARYLRGWAGLNSPCLHSSAHRLALGAPDPESSAPRGGGPGW